MSDVILHIGSPKTGTTSIQHFLRTNREALTAQGWCYPRSPGRARHLKIGLYLRTDDELAQTVAWLIGDYPDPATFRRRFQRRLAAEVADAAPATTLLSDEYLWWCHNFAGLRSLTEPLGRCSRVVVYLRRQDDLLVSSYQQSVKSGQVDRLVDVARRSSASAGYGERLRTWRRELPEAQLTVRRFERAAFPDGSLYQDFLDAVGLDLRAADLEQPETRNESLDAEAVEFLRILNLFRVEHQGATARTINNRGTIGRLRDAGEGSLLSLPEPVLDEVMERVAADNRMVATEFFGTDELFATARPTRATVTHQRLDPARVDYFLDVAAVPTEHHARIRAIAEREARVADAETGR